MAPGQQPGGARVAAAALGAPREIVSLDTPWGPVRIKRSRRPDGTLLCKPEMDDLVELARRHALAPAALRRTVLELLEAQP